MHNKYSAARAILLAGLFVIGSVSLAQDKRGDPVRDVDVSLGRKPPSIIGHSTDDVVREFGSEPNSNIKESGISLNDLLTRPVQRELVWSVVLTTREKTLAFQAAKAWSPWSTTNGLGRTAYWHVGFDREGKAVASAVWLGKSVGAYPHHDQMRADTTRSTFPAARPRLQADPTYWNFEFGAIVSALGETNRVEYYAEPRKEGVLTDPHKCKARCPIHTKGGITAPPPNSGILMGMLLPQRASNGSYGQDGWAMARGMTESVNWLVVGRTWPVITTIPTGGGEPPNFLFLPTPKSGLMVGDACLILETGPDAEPQYGKIVPTTNDQAIKQAGVK